LLFLFLFPLPDPPTISHVSIGSPPFFPYLFKRRSSLYLSLTLVPRPPYSSVLKPLLFLLNDTTTFSDPFPTSLSPKEVEKHSPGQRKGYLAHFLVPPSKAIVGSGFNTCISRPPAAQNLLFLLGSPNQLQKNPLPFLPFLRAPFPTTKDRVSPVNHLPFLLKGRDRLLCAGLQPNIFLPPYHFLVFNLPPLIGLPERSAKTSPFPVLEDSFNRNIEEAEFHSPPFR